MIAAGKPQLRAGLLRHGVRGTWKLVSVVVMLSLLAPCAWGAVLDVHELETANLTTPGERITVTGRFHSYNGRRLLMVGSDIEFRLGDGVRNIGSRNDQLQLLGQMKQEGNRRVFVIEYMSRMPGDADAFRARWTKIPAEDFPALYELSRWARQRADWYADAELKRLSCNAYRDAFQAETETLAKRQDAVGLLTLALRGEVLGLSPREAESMRHRAIWIRVRQLDPNGSNAATWAEIVNQMLPGALEPGAPIPQAALDWYLQNPLATYEPGDETERRRMHRMLWTELTRRAMEPDVHKPGADLADIAARAAQLMPDRPEWAAELRLTDARVRAPSSDRLSRSEMLALRDALLELGQNAEAAQVVERWVDRRYRELAGGDAEGRIRLAADCLAWGCPEEIATKLFIEADAIAPGLDEAQAGLEKLGYSKREGVWQRTDSPHAQSSPDSRSNGPKGIQAGMTEAELLKILPVPSRVTRVLTGRQTTEMWIYNGPPRLYVYLRRSPAGGPATVISTYAP